MTISILPLHAWWEAVRIAALRAGSVDSSELSEAPALVDLLVEGPLVRVQVVMDRAMNREIDDRAGDVHRRDMARVIRLIVVVALIGAVVVVALDNRDDVRLGYVFGDVSAPVWLVILGAAVVGVLVGWLIRHRPRNE